MPRASELSPEFVLLGLLCEGHSYGYELHQRLSKEFNRIWALSQSQCYNILKRLEDQDAVRGEIVQQERAPDRKLLHITPAGQKRFLDWLQTPTPGSSRAIRISFLTRLYFAIKDSDEFARNIITDQKHEIQSTLNHLENTLDQISPSRVINRLSLQLRIRQLRTCIEWLDDCQSAMNSYIKRNGG